MLRCFLLTLACPHLNEFPSSVALSVCASAAAIPSRAAPAFSSASSFKASISCEGNSVKNIIHTHARSERLETTAVLKPRQRKRHAPRNMYIPVEAMITRVGR